MAKQTSNRNRGFGAMSDEKQRQIDGKGGKASQGGGGGKKMSNREERGASGRHKDGH